MKKIFTLVVMAMLTTVVAMAQITLGSAKFSLKAGTKVNPARTNIVLTFPNIEGVADPINTKMEIAGSFVELGEDGAFDGIEGTVGEGVVISLGDFDLPAGSDITLSINSVKIEGTELLADTAYTLAFKTRGAERKMSWRFMQDEESCAKILADADSETPVYWTYVKAGDNARMYAPKRSWEELLFADGTPLPITEELTFNCGASKIYVGGNTTGSYKDILAFNANNLGIMIPDCEAGDIITFNANRATKASSSKFTTIFALDGAAIAPEGFISQSGLQDSIQLGSSYANFKFKVEQSGDVYFTLSNCLLKGIDIEPGAEQVECTYNIVAGYTVDGETTVIKEVVAPKKAMSGTTVKTPYSYWLADAAGNLYTLGTRGTEFTYSFDLKGDTTFVLPYKKTDIENVVFCEEMENVEGTTLCGSANAAVRSSNCKAAYAAEDVKIMNLPAGTYKMKAVLYDANKTPSYVATFKVGEKEVYVSATQENFSEAESDVFTIEEDAEVVYVASGDNTHGVDLLAIYETDEMPDSPGDANEDGSVSVADLALMASYILGDDVTINIKNADVNADEAITVADLAAVAAMILGAAE